MPPVLPTTTPSLITLTIIPTGIFTFPGIGIDILCEALDEDGGFQEFLWKLVFFFTLALYAALIASVPAPELPLIPVAPLIPVRILPITLMPPMLDPPTLAPPIPIIPSIPMFSPLPNIAFPKTLTTEFRPNDIFDTETASVGLELGE